MGKLTMSGGSDTVYLSDEDHESKKGMRTGILFIHWKKR